MKKYEKKLNGDRIGFWDMGREVFSMEESLLQERQAVLVKLGGNLRADSVHEFKTEMGKFVTVGLSLVLDLSGVTGLSAAYMHEFVHLEQELERRTGLFLELQDPSDAAAEALIGSGIHALLNITVKEQG